MKRVFAACLLIVFLVVVVAAADIHEAVKNGDYVKVKELVEGDSSLVSAKVSGGVTPLHVAAAMDMDRIAILLIDKGANTTAQTRNNATPLHWAAMKNATKAAAVLLRAGADISARMSNGMTPLQVATSKNASGVVALLRKAGRDREAMILADKRFRAAQRDFEAGKQEAAFYAFSQLLREFPDSEELNGAIGMSALAAQKYPHAAAAFERILMMNPEHERARFELGRSYLLQERFDLAKERFEEVVARTSDEAVRKAAEDYLRGIKSSSGAFQFRAAVNAGMLYDDNVNVGPGSEVVSIAPLTLDTMTISELTVGEDSLPVSDWGFVASLSASLLYDVGRRGGLGLTAAGSYYQTWLSDASEYDTLYFGGGAGLKYSAGKHLVQMPFSVRQLQRGGESLVNLYGAAPTWLVALGKGYSWHWITSASYESREYAEDYDERDGPFMSVTGTLRHFVGKRRHSVSLGASYFSEDTESSLYRNDGFGYSLVGEIRLPWRATAYATVRYKSIGYKDKTSLETENRKDDQFQYGFGLSRVSKGGYGLNVGLQYTDNSSTFGLYDYTRLMATVTGSISY